MPQFKNMAELTEHLNQLEKRIELLEGKQGTTSEKALTPENIANATVQAQRNER